MDNTEEQISLAFDKLPRSTQDILFTPEIEKLSQAIGTPLSVLAGGTDELNALTNMALLKLADEKEFAEKLVAQLKINTDIAQKITSDVFSQIINPIRQKEEEEEKAQAEALEKATAEEEMDEQEEVEAESPSKVANEEQETPATPTETLETKEVKSTAWKSGATRLRADTRGQAPDNLPVAEAPEYLVPSIPSKTSVLESRLKGAPPREEESEEEAHPFEEKMKRVFTGGQQTMGDLTLTPAAPQVPTATQPSHSDPYREPIE